MTRFVAGSATLVGSVRAANEDAVLVADGLVAVADGMGGHNAGEVASADTVEVISAAAGLGTVADLVTSVHRANRRVHERAATDEGLHGMGTTVCVAGLVRHDETDQVAVLNVGDSRAYLLAEGALHRLTEDHSLVEGLVREGRISPAEAEVHPQRNVVTRALGVEPLVVVDAWLLSPRDGDRLLLCSDGLVNELDEDRIRELLDEREAPEVTARRLAAEADAAGGRDNISVVVVDVAGTGESPGPLDGRYRPITTPVVDLSDPDDHGPRTDTHLAVVTPAERPGDDDLDGDELDEDDEDDEELDDDELDDHTTDDRPGGASAAAPRARPGAPDSAGTTEPDDEELDAADPVGDDGGAGGRSAGAWQNRLWLAALVGVIVVAAGVLVIALLQDEPARPERTTTTIERRTTTTTTTAPTTTETLPAEPVPADPGALLPPAPAPAGP